SDILRGRGRGTTWTSRLLSQGLRSSVPLFASPRSNANCFTRGSRSSCLPEGRAISARIGLAIVILAWLTPLSRADVRLAGIFGDHMVLQQGVWLPVWGEAAAGERVTVSAAGQTASVRAAADGRWRVDLE